ncbi:hypothetical protein CCUS01_06445 [Colletotrichum cuscutae]|uniref:Uncharacterized protein n=1 Tax=Colletotrichum cuscutae TaxID=1209917 RepID=A0AAI9V4T7_9PEZI|nr:hypothetical protein CCUS01_06445 [Colletotrichum cuscutae]
MRSFSVVHNIQVRPSFKPSIIRRTVRPLSTKPQLHNAAKRSKVGIKPLSRKITPRATEGVLVYPFC